MRASFPADTPTFRNPKRDLTHVFVHPHTSANIEIPAVIFPFDPPCNGCYHGEHACHGELAARCVSPYPAHRMLIHRSCVCLRGMARKRRLRANTAPGCDDPCQTVDKAHEPP